GTRHLRVRPLQDLRLRLPGAQEHKPGDPARRDLRPARSERGRQDHPHQHHLRHRQPDQRRRAGRRPRHHHGVPGGPVHDRPRPPRAHYRRVRDRMGDRNLQPGAVRQTGEPRLRREGAQEPFPVGQKGQQDHHALRRHEAPGHDRQGPLARAADPLSGRADGGRGRRAAPGHVGDGALAARDRRDHNPDHPLHRRGRRDGRPDRGDQQRRDRPGRRQGRAHAQARQKAVDAAVAREGGQDPGRARRLPPGARGRWQRAGLRLRRAKRARGHRRLARGPGRDRDQVQGPPDQTKLAGGDLRQLGEGRAM
ncbi:MAG: Efflux ABC transporter, ATP-binding protein, partial [uncultured Rubrobacteraceae bacterium]